MRGKTGDDAGDIQFRSDHTFTLRELPVTYSHQYAGEWQARRSMLVLNFTGDTHPPNATHVEFALTMRDQDHFTVRNANGLETTLERLK